MNILAIETSCDDTAIAIAEVKKPAFRILANLVSSQIKIHRKWYGVYPALAKREHQKNLVPVLKGVLAEAGLIKKRKILKREGQDRRPKLKILKEILIREELLLEKTKSFLTKYEKPDIGLISITVGPGLEPCLWVGVNFAKALAYWWNLPMVAVNHIEAHIFANFVGSNSKFKNQKSKVQFKIRNLFPAICLVVSGGHSQLILMAGPAKYKVIGETRDDAAGECFDKTAKILGLDYPGGPAIAQAAEKYIGPTYVFLPRPMLKQKNYDFSFSGLKTAVLYRVRAEKARQWSKNSVRAMAAEIQQAIIDVLIKKTLMAAKTFKAKSIILGGGVSANRELRRQLKEKVEKELPLIKFLAPEIQYATDNAAMVAMAGNFHLKEVIHWKKITADANLRI